jgi:adenylate cyclase
MRTMTILFSDIRGFTSIAEQFDAEGLTRFMNQFLTPMTAIVLEQHGTIDKYIGDCVMAFWNAPLDDPDHVRHACEAALAMRRHLVQWNRDRYEEHRGRGTPFIPVNVGVGINTGVCCVGNLGSEQRFDYSVLGDAVNLASRLEGQTKTYGVDIVVGPSTHELLQGFATLELDLLTVAGKTKPVRIFAVLGDAAFAADAQFQALRMRHEELLAAYRAQGWPRAQELLESCLALDTERLRLRTFYRLYAERISAYRAHPPGPGWNGVFVASSK